ncbi:MAG: ATP-binding protein [Granulosicoccus sp.]
MADRVRQGIFKKELRHTAMLAQRNNTEFMQLAYAAAHDLQEPLRTQASYFDLTKEALDAGNYKDVFNFLRRTENAAERMSSLVTDLLGYSQLGASTKREIIDLSKIVEDICEELKPRLTETQAQLTIDELPVIVGDESKMQQLVKNLLTNAIKYVDSGTVPTISIFTRQAGSFWTLNVADNGIGIDPAYHSRIFDMFKRLHGKNDYDGTGIGLAICAKVAESMGAEIGVDSDVGRGSTFWVRFHNSNVVEQL